MIVDAGVLVAFFPPVWTGTTTAHTYKFLRENVASTILGTIVGIVYRLVSVPLLGGLAYYAGTNPTSCRSGWSLARHTTLAVMNPNANTQTVPHTVLDGWLHAGLFIIPVAFLTFAHGFPLINKYWYGGVWLDIKELRQCV